MWFPGHEGLLRMENDIPPRHVTYKCNNSHVQKPHHPSTRRILPSYVTYTSMYSLSEHLTGIVEEQHKYH